MKKNMGIVALLAGLFLYIPSVLAQNKYEFAFGNYVVYYNTFPSTFLDKNIAKNAGLTRSESRGIITIVIRQLQKDGSDKPIKAASVSGTATNLMSQVSNLKLKEIRDGDVIYYIGDFPIFKEDQLSFHISITPAGETQSQDFKFERQF